MTLLEKFRRAQSPDECRGLVYGHTPEELGTVIFALTQAEQHYSPEQIAKLEGMSSQTIRHDIKAGLFGGEYFARNARQLRVSASGVHQWRQLFRVQVKDRAAAA
jgi:hypothetical protein